MSVVSRNNENMTPIIFAELKNISLVNLMCLKELINIVIKGKSIFNYMDFSYQLIANNWDADLSKVKQNSEIKMINEVKNKLISKYGLINDSSKSDVLQILGFANDKDIDIKLLGIVKKSLNYFKNLIDENKLGSVRYNYWSNYMLNEWLCENEFIKMKGQKKFIIDKKWYSYIRSNQDDIYDFCSNSLHTLLNGKSLNINNSKIKNNQGFKKDFSVLKELEIRIKLHQVLDKNRYSCLELAFEWLNFTVEDYTKYKIVYDAYMSKCDIQNTAKTFPFVTSLILLYTAIYRYNDEDSNGFWPEFFGRRKYKYNEVKIVMKAFTKIISKFKINTEDRCYLEKINLSQIFSHIYMPDVSIRKIYSAIYKYFFKYNNQRLVNAQLFLEDNLYRLDKPGIFFLAEDKIIDDSFAKIMELFNESLDNNRNLDNIDYLPKRFLVSFEKWLESDKAEIDSQKDDYYIASPRIRFDIANEKMALVLPQQRSRIYSDEKCGWKISLDNSKATFSDGRIVKRKDGVYIILDEELILGHFKNLEIEYVFNNKVQGKWNFENTESFILFNEHGYYINGNKLNRSKCVVGVRNADYNDEDYIIEELVIPNWNEFIFYYLDLEDINRDQLVFNGEKETVLEIDDIPSIKRNLYKLVLEEWEVSPSDFKGTPVYEYIGKYSFNTPGISKEDIEVNICPLSDCITFDHSSVYKKVQISSNNIEVNFNRDKISNGFYSLLIKYKERTIIRESFILIDPIEYIDEFAMSYDKVNYNHNKLILKKNSKYKIEPSHISCFISEDHENYYIEPSNVAEAKFNLVVDDISVPIEKIILPLRWSITGLESILDNKTDNKTKEITKQAFDNNDIRLQVRNFDYRYKTLTYRIDILEQNSNKRITEIRKLGYRDKFSLLFDHIKDRMFDFSNTAIKMSVINEKQELLYEKVLLNVVKKIKMLNFKLDYNETSYKIRWDEDSHNKSRVLKLYNYINPWKDDIKIELEEGITDVIIPLNKMEYGSYVPVLDYKREFSLFDNIENEMIFFKRKELKNIITNTQGMTLSNEDLILGKLLHNYKEGNDTVQLVRDIKKLENLSNYKAFLTLIQMKYLVDKSDYNQVSEFIRDSFEIINVLINLEGFDKAIEGIYELRDKLNDDDLRLCSAILLAARKNKVISEEKVEILSEINIIDALCSVKNGSGKITNNLKSRCISTFDKELLGMVRNYIELSSVIKEEIEIINSFWSWLIDHKNKKILRKGYSLSRAFRIYEFEKDISSFKVNGNKMDDLVENIRCDKKNLYLKLPQRLAYSDEITNDKFQTIKDLINISMDDNYRSLLIVSLLSINCDKNYSNFDYYQMIINEYLGNRWELFERYRAFFKLMFL
ncbi:MAG: hypothetical protein ACOCRO_01590 [Halanaerobiales bacterium]